MASRIFSVEFAYENLDATLDLANAVNIPVILSGGVSSMADLETVVAADSAKLEGVISGRALYDGQINPTDAVQLLNRAKAT